MAEGGPVWIDAGVVEEKVRKETDLLLRHIPK